MICFLFYSFTFIFLSKNALKNKKQSLSNENFILNHNSYKNFNFQSFSDIENNIQNIDFNSKLIKDIPLNSNNEDEIVIKDEVWKKSHESFSFEKVYVKSCKFIDCRFPDAQGGAIISITFLDVENSLFSKCFARSGGSICSMFDLTVKNSNFLDSFAKRGGSIHQQYGTCELIETLFASSASTVLGGSFYSTESQLHLSSHTNYSSSSCKEDASAAYIEKTNINIGHNIVSNCHLIRGTGGFLLKLTEGKISNSIFSNNCFDDIVGGGASSIEISGTKETVNIENSYFYMCSAFNYWSIRGRFKPSTIIINCYFSNKQEIEINIENVDITNCFFEQNKFPIKIPKNQYKYNEPIDKPEIYRAYGKFFSYFGRFILPFIIVILVIHELIDSFRIMKMRKKNIE